MNRPKVFLDACIFKFAADRLRRLIPEPVTVKWGDITCTEDVYSFVTMLPNEKITNNPQQKHETSLLRKVANLGKQNKVNFVINVETDLETWNIPNMDSKDPAFSGVDIQFVDAPITYRRVTIAWDSDPVEDQYNFLGRIEHPRFQELQKYTGAYQGKNKLNRNQLLDAFHVWCAEHNNCEYFLTLDQKLIKHLQKQKNFKSITKIVSPSELLQELQQ